MVGLRWRGTESERDGGRIDIPWMVSWVISVILVEDELRQRRREAKGDNDAVKDENVAEGVEGQ